MTSAEFKDAIRPFVRQFMQEQVDARSSQWTVYNADTLCKRNVSAVIHAEFAPICRAKSDAITREREIYQ